MTPNDIRAEMLKKLPESKIIAKPHKLGALATNANAENNTQKPKPNSFSPL